MHARTSNFIHTYIMHHITPHLPFYTGERLDIDYGRLSKSKEMQQQTAKPTSSESQSQIHNNMMMENEETISTLQIINIGVYVLFLSGIIYYMNRDYDNLVTKWFVMNFPREAATFGLHVEL